MSLLLLSLAVPLRRVCCYVLLVSLTVPLQSRLSLLQLSLLLLMLRLPSVSLRLIVALLVSPAYLRDGGAAVVVVAAVTPAIRYTTKLRLNINIAFFFVSDLSPRPYRLSSAHKSNTTELYSKYRYRLKTPLQYCLFFLDFRLRTDISGLDLRVRGWR